MGSGVSDRSSIQMFGPLGEIETFFFRWKDRGVGRGEGQVISPEAYPPRMGGGFGLPEGDHAKSGS